MIASISWDFGDLYFYEFETGEVLSYSLRLRSWKWTRGHLGSSDPSFRRDKGTVEIDQSFILEIKAYGLTGFILPEEHKYYKEPGRYFGQEKHQEQMMDDIREEIRASGLVGRPADAEEVDGVTGVVDRSTSKTTKQKGK